jgi:hypothetical protein
LSQFSKNYITQKFVTKLTKILLWDPGSEIRKKPIPDPGSGSRGQKGTGSRIRNRNTVSNNGKVIIFYLRTSAPSSDDSARQQAMRAINTAAASWVRRKSYLNKSSEKFLPPPYQQFILIDGREKRNANH